MIYVFFLTNSVEKNTPSLFIDKILVPVLNACKSSNFSRTVRTDVKWGFFSAGLTGYCSTESKMAALSFQTYVDKENSSSFASRKASGLKKSLGNFLMHQLMKSFGDVSFCRSKG